MPLLEQVLSKNPQSVKIVHKNLPLRFHKMALPAAQAAHAAEKQGKFWQYHDGLYREKKLTPDSLNKIAESLNLNMEQFNRDRSSPGIKRFINKDVLEAQRLGVTGTPTVFINGRKLKNRSLNGFQKLIDDALRKQQENEGQKS